MLSIEPTRNARAARSEGSSLVSSVDRGHQAPCTNPHDRCAGFNCSRRVPMAGRRADASAMFSVVAVLLKKNLVVGTCVHDELCSGAGVVERMRSPSYSMVVQI